MKKTYTLHAILPVLPSQLRHDSEGYSPTVRILGDDSDKTVPHVRWSGHEEKIFRDGKLDSEHPALQKVLRDWFFGSYEKDCKVYEPVTVAVKDMGEGFGNLYVEGGSPAEIEHVVIDTRALADNNLPDTRTVERHIGNPVYAIEKNEVANTLTVYQSFDVTVDLDYSHCAGEISHDSQEL